MAPDLPQGTAPERDGLAALPGHPTARVQKCERARGLLSAKACHITRVPPPTRPKMTRPGGSREASEALGPQTTEARDDLRQESGRRECSKCSGVAGTTQAPLHSLRPRQAFPSGLLP